jgi:hypothetical protein
MEDILEGEAWKRPLVEKAVARVVLEGSLTLVIAGPPLQFFFAAPTRKKTPLLYTSRGVGGPLYLA